jgi:hypothetical protein
VRFFHGRITGAEPENRKTLAKDAKMREEGEEKERKRKGERRWEKNPSPVHGIRHLRKPPNHRHRAQANQTTPEKNQPKSRYPILAMSRKLIIIMRASLLSSFLSFYSHQSNYITQH